MENEGNVVIGSTVHGDIIKANYIINSFNKIKNSAKDDGLKEQLTLLTQKIGEICSKIPDDQKELKENLGGDLESMVNEATREKPGEDILKPFFSRIKNGLEKAAEFVKPVTDLVQTATPILIGLGKVFGISI